MELDELIQGIEISEQTLSTAATQQGSLFRRAAQYYVKAMRLRLAAQAAYDEKKAQYGQAYRKKDQIARQTGNKKGKEMTETELNEKLLLVPDIRKVRDQLNDAKVREEYAERLLKAFDWRGAMIKVLAGLATDEARAELRVMADEKAKKELDRRITEKYPAGAGDEDD